MLGTILLDTQIFQFLMVRLKVLTTLLNVSVIRFQFLMVRLKAELGEYISSLSKFQFLMVRLKEI